jgi:peptide/nickel transport system permease protein
MGAFLVIFGLCLMAVFAPFIAPHNPDVPLPNSVTALGAPMGPSAAFPLGADELGRDVLSRIIWGARISLEVGFASTLIAVVVAVVLGVAAGYLGGWVDQVVMRVADVVLAFPFLLFVILLVSVLRPSVGIIIVTIGAFSWAPMARVVRGQALSTSRNDFVEGARASGAGALRIMFAHILPNMLGPVVVYGCLQVGTNILTEAALAFLGLGAPPPTPDWGSMVSEGQQYMQVAPWLLFYPGLAIVLTVVSFNVLGDGLNEALNPRGKWA